MSGIFFFDVPYTDKDKAKDKGARWSKDEKSWYAPNVEIKKQMLGAGWKENISKKKSDTIPERKGWQLDNKFSYYFDISIENGTFAEKALGAIFDPEMGQWMAPNRNDNIWNQIIRYFPQTLEKKTLLTIDKLTKRKNYEYDEFETYDFDVPYIEKDYAKQLRSIFDKDKKCWIALNLQIWHYMIQYWPQKTNKLVKKEKMEEEEDEHKKPKTDNVISHQFALDDSDFAYAKSLGAIYCVETELWTAPNNEVWEQMCDKWEPI